MLESLGADRVIDYTKEDFTRSRRAYNIIFDAVGKSSFSRSKGALKPGGIYLSTVPTLATLFHMLRTAKLDGKKAKLAATGLRRPSEKVEDLVFLRELAETGRIRSVIDRRYPLEQAAEAHRHVETGHKKGNVLVVVENGRE